MDKKVLTKEEIEKLASLQEEQNQLILGLGNVDYQLNYLKNSKEELYNKLRELETKQSQVAQELEKKYGRGTVNLESGEFVQA